MASLGVNPHTISLVLDHISVTKGTVTSAVYVKYSFDRDRSFASADVVEHEADGVGVDAKRGHARSDGSAKVVHAENGEADSRRARPIARVAAWAVIGLSPTADGNTHGLFPERAMASSIRVSPGMTTARR